MRQRLVATLSRLDILQATGTIGMEGLGPSAGKAKALGVVLVGANAFAMDSLCCGIMGMSAHKVPHLRMGAQKGYGVIDLDLIDVTPQNWKEVQSTFALIRFDQTGIWRSAYKFLKFSCFFKNATV